ncbi:MAG: hypothetical protein A2Y03_10230 [Omnitrophica WOR_2 bacterium GWF2_38_59]|nr:MAG: hypothetical protein A2Y03_10230 [Omnitrophica WOR_2 bacterium GWF2_38_59]
MKIITEKLPELRKNKLLVDRSRNLVYAASRPDILTTVTTVAALFPTIYGVGGGRGNSDPNSNGTCIWITVLKFADPFSYAVALYD